MSATQGICPCGRGEDDVLKCKAVNRMWKKCDLSDFVIMCPGFGGLDGLELMSISHC